MQMGSFFLSLLAHIAVFLLLFFWPTSAPYEPERVSYQVSLVMGDMGGEDLPATVLGARAPVSDTPTASTTLNPSATTAPAAPEVMPEATSAPAVVEPNAPPAVAEAIPAPPPPAQEPPKPPAIVPEPTPIPRKDPEPEAPKEPDKPKEPEKPKEQEKPKDPPKPKEPPKAQEKPKRDPVKEALAGAEKQTGSQTSKPANNTRGGSASRALAELENQTQVGVGGGGGSGSGPGGGGIYDVYAGLVILAVKPNWSMPTYSRQNISVLVRIKLDPSGRVLDCSIERSSGRADFDASAMNAVIRTGTLPPPPSPAQQDIAINFNALELAGAR